MTAHWVILFIFVAAAVVVPWLLIATLSKRRGRM